MFPEGGKDATIISGKGTEAGDRSGFWHFIAHAVGTVPGVFLVETQVMSQTVARASPGDSMGQGLPTVNLSMSTSLSLSET